MGTKLAAFSCDVMEWQIMIYLKCIRWSNLLNQRLLMGPRGFNTVNPAQKDPYTQSHLSCICGFGEASDNATIAKYGLFSYITPTLRRNMIVPNYFGKRGFNGQVAMAFGRYLK